MNPSNLNFAKMIFLPYSNILTSLILIIECLLIVFITTQNSIGVDCIFKEGDKMNCRQYCSNYFKKQPQLAWYNISSHQCEPLKICSWYLHYYDYSTNQCYTDQTQQNIGPSEYPDSLIEQRIATFLIDNICVNGVSQSGTFNDARCYCYFLWENSGKVDLNGYPYKCDKVIGPQKWKEYFLNELILAPNKTVLMYGQYTPEQLQLIYEQLRQKQAGQTLEFVNKYEGPLLSLIQNQILPENLIREHEIIWIYFMIGFFYLVFAFSYLRERNLKIRVTKKQLIQRIQQIIQDETAVGNLE